MILLPDPNGRSVEFRRIVIAEKGRGLGRRVVERLDDIVKIEMARERIGLDVFAHNLRARKLYESCGYRLLGETQYRDAHRDTLQYLYERNLQSQG